MIAVITNRLYIQPMVDHAKALQYIRNMKHIGHNDDRLDIHDNDDEYQRHIGAHALTHICG